MQVPWRVVIDPNVLVSAAISPAGATAAIVGLIDAGAVTAVVSPRLLTELGGVLRRDRFRTWLGLDEVAAYLTDLALADRPTLTPRQLLGELATTLDDPPRGPEQA